MTNFLQIPYSLFRPFYEMTSFHKSVIEDVSNEELKQAYRHCRAITRYHAKTFYLATRFLPNEKQRGVFAIYGLCRYLDNLVDDGKDLISQQKITLSQVDEKLEKFKSNLDKVYKREFVDDPILMAYAHTIEKYKVDKDLPLLLIEGVRQDLDKSRFRNFQEVYDYSYKVASVVGLMTCEIFGYSSKEALQRAVDLGIAMQLTNILRDVGEDLERGRIYIPKEDLDRFNISEEELFACELTEKFKDLMKFQVSRARSYYKNAFDGIEMLTKDSRLPVYLAYRNYSRILNKIEENNYDVFNKRAFLNQSEKFSILPKVLLDLKKAS